MPVLDAPEWAMVVLDVGVWGGWSALAGYLAHRRPARAFERDTWLYRTRRFERRGRFYEDRLRIKRWKDHLPEAGALFTGGFSKRALRARDPEALTRFVVETRRAEWAHWLIMAITPVFLLWSWPWVELVMVLYALAANAPCLLVQRYNRARLQVLLARWPPAR